jgi:putative membrane protein
MEKPRNLTKLYPVILYIIFGVGAVLHALPFTLSLALSLTPYLLVGINLLVIRAILGDQTASNQKRLLVWIALAYLFTLAVEIIGVKTGLIFGAYNYGPVLGWQLLDVPLVIGLNWVIVVLGAIALSSKYCTKAWQLIPLAAIITVGFDFIMEPVAIKFDYWQWVGGTIPLQNYLAWFVLSFIAGLLFSRLKLTVTNNIVIHLLVAQTIFFAVLNLV